MCQYNPLKFALLTALLLTIAVRAQTANVEKDTALPAGASKQQIEFCATVLSSNEEVSRRTRALEGKRKLIDAKVAATPEAASDEGLARLFASLGPTRSFKNWTGRASLRANGGSAGIVLSACQLRNAVSGDMIDVRLSGGGIPVKSQLAKTMALMNEARDVVISGFFVSRQWPNNLVQFNMMPREIRHPVFDIQLTSIAQAR